ncbi:MAG: XdhC family protein [Puniceicoccaceae bacterium]|nr:XdhC family protein [Puniceicoccaceae bacterium]
MSLSDFWQAAHEALSNGKRIHMSLVVDQTKGSPGTTAARMFVTNDGVRYGTIGGGVMESRVLEEAVSSLNQELLPKPRLRQLRHRADTSDQSSGLICGGTQTNLEIALSPELHLELVARIRASAASGLGSVLCTSEGLELTDKLVETVKINQNGEAWEVSLPLLNRRRVAVFGGGHCGVALANAMQRLDYEVTILDSRSDISTTEGLAKSIKCVVTDFERAAACVDHPNYTVAIVMTYSMDTDVKALLGLLDKGFEWIGLMGSQVKIAHIRQKLLSESFSDLQIAQIVAPVGIEFNSDTPEEIAISIAAKILLERESKKTV